MAKLANEQENDCCKDEVAYAKMNPKQESNKYTPVFLMFGRTPNSSTEVLVTALSNIIMGFLLITGQRYTHATSLLSDFHYRGLFRCT